MENFNDTIFAPLLPSLKQQTAVMAHLKSKRVSPEQFLVYQFDKELHKAEIAGYFVTAVLILVLGGLGYVGAKDAVEVTNPLWWSLAFGLLGLLIGWGSLRLMRGKHSRYLSYPDATSSGFLALGMVNKWTVAVLKNIPEAEWVRIRTYAPNLAKRRYTRAGGGSKKGEQEKLTKLTPRKLAAIASIERVQRVAAWAILLVVISFFIDSMFFFFWGWFCGGVWIVLEMVRGFIERRVGGFAAASTVEILGWPARVIAVILIPIFTLIFLVPGLFGMLKELGITIW